MNYSGEEVVSWLQSHGFSPETLERIEKDGLDGEDLLGIVQYVEELRHYFPLVKERLKFKKLILMNAEPRDGASSSSCAESSSTSNSFYTSTDDSQNTSDDENLELTSTPNEKGKSPKDFCIMDEAIELGIAKEKTQGASWSVKEEKCRGKQPSKTLPLGWLSKFQLPSRFSASVELGIQEGYLSANQKSELVRDVCTSINHFTSHPKRSERQWIAKKIVEEYPCMAGKKLVDSDTEWGYLEVKIFNRMKKIQKPKHPANPAEAGPSKAKRQKKDFSIWAQQPDLPAGETLATLKAFAEENRNEVRRNPRKHKAHKDFMDKTFPLRRHEIITAPKLVKAVLMEYPSLKYFIHLKAELCRIFNDDNIPTKLREKYLMWQQHILKYAAASKDKVVNEVMDGMEAALSEEGCNREEIKSRTSLLVINKVLRQRSGKKRGLQEEVVTILEREADVDSAVIDYIQPQIVIVGDIYDIDLLYIVTEGSIICQLPQEKIIDAVIGLLGSFYVFNVSYNQSKAILTFLEQALLEIGRGQTLVTVSSFFNDLANA